MKVKTESAKRTGRTVLSKTGDIDDVQKFVAVLLVSMILSAAVAFWPLVFIIFGMIIALEATAFYLRICRRNEKEESIPVNAAADRETTENDVVDLAFGVAMKRITQFLRVNFPSATWAFETQRPKEKFASNQPIYIVLCNACGYRKAKVLQDRLFVRGLAYETVKTFESIIKETEEVIEIEPEEFKEPVEKEKKINYEFIADEWIDNNMEMINGQLNNAAAQNKTEYLLEESILPVKESWKIISERLIENGVKEATTEEKGIKITFRI